MRYRCLILDHDDTVTLGTREIHYPAYRDMMGQLRPGVQILTFDDWMLRNFDPGILGYLVGELGMDEDELEREYQIWRSHSIRSDPSFFPGVLELLDAFRAAGGIVGVVSHSEAEIIERNYLTASGGAFVPDVIYGWEMPEDQRKPNPWPVRSILERYRLQPAEALVVDDLKPGVDMARAAGVAVAAAGWAYTIERIREYMTDACDYYFETIESFREHVFAEPAFP